jgi:DNA-binding MarR family transcriptional regulator
VKPEDRGRPKLPKPSKVADTLHGGMLGELLGYHLRRAQAAVFADFMRAMAKDRITPGQFGVLVLIDRNPGLNQSALARVLGIERSTMVAVLDGLEDRKLVARQGSNSDRRSKVLSLTQRGKALLADVKPKVRRHEKRIAADLHPDEVTALIGLLKRIGRTS